jgi:outer membrane protein TolC
LVWPCGFFSSTRRPWRPDAAPPWLACGRRSTATELDAARKIVSTQQKAVELAREGLSIAEVSYENGVITATELNDARLSLLETESELMQAKYGQIVAAARTRYAAGL